jgi:hypothetical protein
MKLPRAALSLLLLATACNQDSIFDYVAGETAPTEARIQGSPSRIVSANTGAGEKLYITNGRIWEYANGKWNRIDGPGGYVAEVASTDSALYAFTIDNTATQVSKTTDGTNWTALDSPTEYGFIQNIFGAGDVLFATGAKRSGSEDYAILYEDKQANPKLIVSNVIGDVLLTGAGKVGSDYYLATRGSGIYKASGSPLEFKPATATPSVPSSMAGLLQADTDLLIGISKGGLMVRIDINGVTVANTSLGGTYTGALALMEIQEPKDDYTHLLLLGYVGADSSYEHGYMELRLALSDGKTDGIRRIPGENQPGSISNYQQYDSSLRRDPVTALWVLPPASANEPSVLFAATSNEGLYSYRDRSGGWQWNSEE